MLEDRFMDKFLELCDEKNVVFIIFSEENTEGEVIYYGEIIGRYDQNVTMMNEDFYILIGKLSDWLRSCF